MSTDINVQKPSRHQGLLEKWMRTSSQRTKNVDRYNRFCYMENNSVIRNCVFEPVQRSVVVHTIGKGWFIFDGTGQ
jgi:hypothetical protein